MHYQARGEVAWDTPWVSIRKCSLPLRHWCSDGGDTKGCNKSHKGLFWLNYPTQQNFDQSNTCKHKHQTHYLDLAMLCSLVVYVSTTQTDKSIIVAETTFQRCSVLPQRSINPTCRFCKPSNWISPKQCRPLAVVVFCFGPKCEIPTPLWGCCPFL